MQPTSRVNDAVKRILAVKLAMKLVEVPEGVAAKHGYTTIQSNDNGQMEES